MNNNLNIVKDVIQQLTEFLRFNEIPNSSVVLATLLYYKRIKDSQVNHIADASLVNNKPFIPGSKEEYIKEVLNHLQPVFEETQFSYAKEILKKVPEGSLLSFDYCFSDFTFSEDSISKEDFGIFFSQAIPLISQARYKDEFVTPNKLSEFISSFIDLKSGDTVFDPFGGSANLIASVARRNPVKAKYLINDINETQVYLGTINLSLNGVRDFSFVCRNSLTKSIKKKYYQRYDWIISDPPMGMIYFPQMYANEKYLKFGTGKRLDSLVIQLILAYLSDKGKAIITVSEGFGFSTDNVTSALRKYLVENDLIELVFSLPAGLQKFSSGIKTTVLFINKKKEKHKENIITFCEVQDRRIFDIFCNTYSDTIKSTDQSLLENKQLTTLTGLYNNYESRYIKKNEVKKNKYALNPNKYIYSEFIPLDDGSEKKHLKVILTKILTGVKLPKESFDIGGIPYVTIKDLNDSDNELNLTFKYGLNFCKESEYTRLKLKRKVVPNKSVLIAKVGQKLKPTLVDSKDEILVSDNIYVLQVDENVISPEYLISQMKEPYFIKQINSIRKGVAQQSINKEDFLNLFIAIPSLNEQAIRLKTYYNKLLEQAKERIGYKEEEKKEQEKTLLSTLRHEYLNRKKPFEGIGQLKRYLNSKVTSGAKLNWDDRITGSKSSATLLEKVNSFEHAIDSLNKIFIDIPKIFKFDKSLIKLTKIGIKEFINNQITILNDQLIEQNIKHKVSGRNYRVSIDPDHFSYVIHNLVLNSIKHAFDPDQKYCLVVFEISLSNDKQTLYLDYKDNGKGLPDGFTFSNFIEFAKKSGENAGSGIGGYLINSIVNNHGGTLALIEDPELLGTYKTFFRINLPYNEF